MDQYELNLLGRPMMSLQRGIVIVMNGRATVGKDTTIGFMRQTLTDLRVPNRELSSIQCVKDMCEKAGIETPNKSETDRALWAEVGDAVEKHSHFRSNSCTKAIESFMQKCKGVFFLHIREELVCRRIQNNLQSIYGEKVKFIRILLESEKRGLQVLSNKSDRDIYNMQYDMTMYNDGTLEDLQQNAKTYITEIITQV